MTVATVAGYRFELDAGMVESAVEFVDPEPIQEHYVVIGGRRFPPKQALALVTGLDRADFTTHQARAILRRLGFGAHRRSEQASGAPSGGGPHGGAEAAALREHLGRWVAQQGIEILFAADDPESVLRWVRRHGLTARVWRVPARPDEAGSAITAP